MIIWLVKLEEPLPIDDNYRPYRMGMLSNALLSRGHHVVMWSSDRIQLTNKTRFGRDKTLKIDDNLTLELLNSVIKYQNSTSALRVFDNFFLARKFLRKAQIRKKPDLIVCSMPTPELAKISSHLGMKYNIPVILDSRDFWPDIFRKELNGIKRFLSWPIVKLMRNDLSFATKNATSLVGITEFYRDHLLKYAKRNNNNFYDGVFPLGYPKTQNFLTKSEKKRAIDFWDKILGKKIFTSERKILYFAGRFNSTVYKALNPINNLVKRSLIHYPDYFFIFCGTGQFEKEIKNTLGDYINVALPGEISSKNLTFLRNKSYLALQPIENRIDYLNSLSNKFFEYISSGLPIITSLKGVTEEVIKRYEIGFTYNNTETLINFMENLYFDKKLHKKLSSNAKKLFEAKFSSEIIYKDYACHCEKIVFDYKSKSNLKNLN